MSFYDDLVEDLNVILEAEKGERELIPVPEMPAPTYIIGTQKVRKESDPEQK